jgi:hypothetical protein
MYLAADLLRLSWAGGVRPVPLCLRPPVRVNDAHEAKVMQLYALDNTVNSSTGSLAMDNEAVLQSHQVTDKYH